MALYISMLSEFGPRDVLIKRICYMNLGLAFCVCKSACDLEIDPLIDLQGLYQI